MAGMFHRINDFGFPRSEKQAVGFYLFHSFVALIGMVLALIVYGVIFGLDAFRATQENIEDSALLMRAVQILSTCYVTYLTVQVLAAKNRLRDPKAVLSGLAGIVLALSGLLMGMIMVSGLSILRPKDAQFEGEK